MKGILLSYLPHIITPNFESVLKGLYSGILSMHIFLKLKKLIQEEVPPSVVLFYLTFIISLQRDCIKTN